MMWNFPKEIKTKIDELGYDDYVRLTQKEAYELLIFEGSWEKDNISDVDGLFWKHFQKDV